MVMKLLFPVFLLSVPSWTVSFEKDPTDWLNSSDDKISNTTQYYLSSQWLIKFVPSVYTLVVVVSLPLNILAVIVFVFNIKMEKGAMVYMLNLAVADVLFVSVLPFNIAYRFSGNNWIIGDGMCRFVTAAFYCNMYCSILLMTSISVDRFLAVVYAIKSLSWRTKTRAWTACSFIWIISIASSLPLLTSKQTFYIDTLNITTCHDVLYISELQNFYKYYFTTFSLLCFFLPLIVISTCYISIIKKLSTKNNEKSRKRTRAVILTVIVFSSFLICFAPTNIIFLIHYLHFQNKMESMYFAYILCTCISSISTCLDPFIYYYASSKYRKYTYSLLANVMQSRLTREKELSTESTSASK
ncbi:proteinase-activated receptor 1-like [Pyxicephalus adspersus]|uniref:proteinase-activated receptor 1-like n=1 Tax=Pyxicephalus adspersus TaxID=30357 RepID=UPI003B5B2846